MDDLREFDIELLILIRDVHSKTLAPVPIIWNSMLCAMSTAYQHKIKVRMPTGLETNCNLYSIVIADSGERKSTVDKYFTTEFLNINAELNQTYTEDLITYKKKYEIWKLDLSAAKRNYSFNEQIEKKENFKIEIEQLVVNEPIKPAPVQLVYNDVTIDSLLQNLSYYPNALLSSTDASYVFNKIRVDKLGVLNELWDGSAITIHRKNAPTIRVDNPKLTLSLMIQPGVLDYYSNSKRDLLRQSGLFARTLFTRPTSTQGTRYLNDRRTRRNNRSTRVVRRIDNNVSPLENFNAKIRSALQSQEEPIKTLIFSDEAKAEWIDFFNNVERDIGVGHELHQFKDFSSKILNNVARLAALIEYHITGESEISYESMLTARMLGNFYINEFIKIFGDRSLWVLPE